MQKTNGLLAHFHLSMSTYCHKEFPLFFLFLTGLVTHGLVFLLHLFQCSDLGLLEAMHLLLIVRSEPGQLLLIPLVLLTQRLRKKRVKERVDESALQPSLVLLRQRVSCTCSSFRTCCLCCSLAAWLWLSSTSLSSSSLFIFSFSRFCSWSRFLMVTSWDIWVACKEPIWPRDSQSKTQFPSHYWEQRW